MMLTSITNAVLSKIVNITNDRDINALEISLSKALYHLIFPIDGDLTSVTLYRPNAAAEDYFSKIIITEDSDGNVEDDPDMSDLFREVLTSCFETGERVTFDHQDLPVYAFYPLKNSFGETMAVISIGILACDKYMYETIAMLLQIYQNFTRLISESENDALTGLLNRKSFENKITKLLSKVRKSFQRRDDRVTYTHYMAIFDIDHFKQVNDQYGHPVGDEVLITFAGLMRQCFRDSDMIFRFGGEEFLVVFACVDPTDMDHVLSRFSQLVAKTTFNQVNEIRFSAGYTRIRVNDLPLKIIDRADTALYYAKENGRNQNCNYDLIYSSEAP